VPSDASPYEQHSRERYYRVVLSILGHEGGTVGVELLRRQRWVDERGVRPGARLPLELAEISVSGTAVVHSVELAPTPKPGPGRLVVGRVTRIANRLARVTLGSGEVIEATTSHPIFSESKKRYRAAGELKSGELVRTLTGHTVVDVVTEAKGRFAVHNIEVDIDHNYFVGAAAALVHNMCTDPDAVERPEETERERSVRRAVARRDELFNDRRRLMSATLPYHGLRRGSDGHRHTVHAEDTGWVLLPTQSGDFNVWLADGRVNGLIVHDLLEIDPFHDAATQVRIVFLGHTRPDGEPGRPDREGMMRVRDWLIERTDVPAEHMVVTADPDTFDAAQPGDCVLFYTCLGARREGLTRWLQEH